MNEELNFEFNDYVIAIDEPYENDCGYVAIGKKQSNGINIVFKSPNKGTVNWFIELQKYITDLQSQLNHQKAMWNALKEWLRRAGPGYMDDGLFDCAGAIYEVIDKMQDLEKGEKDGNIK